MQPNNGGRILFDISTSMRWAGPPVGIVRVERKLALWAYSNVPGVAFVFFDPDRRAYCEVTRDVRAFLTGEAALDTLGMTNPALPGRRRTDRIPAAVRPGLLWLVQARRTALNRLERLRLRTQRPWLAGLADRLQRRLMSSKHRRFMVRDDGTRRPFVPYDMAVGARVVFGSDVTLVCAGSGWGHTNIEALSELKSRTGFRLVLLCYDLIPLMFPHFYRDHDVELFRNYMHRALAIADRIVVNSRTVEADCRAYCARRGIAAGEIALAPLGFDVEPNSPKSVAELPAGLVADRFVLLVSTIEPRKGHRLLLDVWRRLIVDGVPQAEGFKLVFVGRVGWMVDDVLKCVRSDPQLAGHVVMIQDVDDERLSALYRGAAFCVYPSFYEGYGLPVIEAFAHGKGVLASTGGALPEVVHGLSPCLDPADQPAWYETMKQWIESPHARAPYERDIRVRFWHPTWSEAAGNFFAGILATEL